MVELFFGLVAIELVFFPKAPLMIWSSPSCTCYVVKNVNSVVTLPMMAS